MRSKFKLPLACSATAWSLFFSLTIAGCGSTPAPVVQAKSAPKSQDVAPLTPDLLASSQFYIFSGGERIHYGDDVDLALNEGGYKRPEKSASVNRVPAGLGANYQCYGWETATRAFGVLSRKGKVVLALDTYEQADQQALDDLRKAYIDKFGPPISVEGEHVHYDFWNKGEVSLMLCATVDDRGSLSFSTALGNAELMAYFRMDPASAKSDQIEADRLLATPRK